MLGTSEKGDDVDSLNILLIVFGGVGGLMTNLMWRILKNCYKNRGDDTDCYIQTSDKEFIGLDSMYNLESLIEKDIFGAMQIPIFYIIKCKFFLKNSAKLHSIWIDCCTAVEKQTWEHEFIYNIALLHTL